MSVLQKHPHRIMPSQASGTRRILTHCRTLLASAMSLFILTATPTLAFWNNAMDEAPPEDYRRESKVNPVFIAEKSADILAAGINELGRQLIINQIEPDLRFSLMADGMAVCSFVELKKLTRTSSFGRYLAEQLMTIFQQQGYPVNEIRKTNDILIQEQRGEYGLSRDPESISNAVESGTLLTGTYTLTDHHVFINARILDAKTGIMLSSGSNRLLRTHLINTLLADRASAETRQPEKIFMKQLEL